MIPANVTIIDATDEAEVIAALKEADIRSVHVTNGTYAPPPALITATTVAGFQYLADTHPDKDAALTVAINSDNSMRAMLAAKNAPQAERDALENQDARAEKVWSALAAQFPDRRILILFYDKQTPHDLYEAMAADGGIGMASLHKWAYGTNPDAPKIEGADFFAKVFGFPLPKDTDHLKPVYWQLTPAGQAQHVEVVDLCRAVGANGRPYISPQNKLLCETAPALAAYRDPSAGTAAAPSPAV